MDLDELTGELGDSSRSPRHVRHGATSALAKSLNSPHLRHKIAHLDHPLEALVSSDWFDLTFSMIVVANAMLIAMEVQYSGLDLGVALSYPGSYNSADEAMPLVGGLFGICEDVFGILYIVEIVIKLAGLRCRFWRDLTHYLDLMVVAFWLVDKLGRELLPVNPQVLRIARLARLMRLVRLVKNLAVSDSLYIMTTSIKGSLVFLTWASVLLIVINMFFALALSQILHETYFERPQYSMEDKRAVYRYFGTFFRGMLSMFELSMGNFPPIVWLLTEKVTGWFILFCLMHKLTVGFAVVGVINSVFMQETFKCAAQDDYLLKIQRERADKTFQRKMEMLFLHADEDGNASLSPQEFHDLVNEPVVKIWLASLGLCTRDSDNLFALVDSDNNKQLTVDELIKGAAVVKGEARSIDMHTLMREVRDLAALIRRMEVRHLQGVTHEH